MKLKTFEQFINERRKLTSSDISTSVDECVFLIDGIIYFVMDVELGGDVTVEKPEPDVGFYGGAYVEEWDIDDASDIEKFANPEDNASLLELIQSYKDGLSNLHSMGMSSAKTLSKEDTKIISDKIYGFVESHDLVEVSEEEANRVVEKLRENEYTDLTGTFDDRANDALNDAVSDWEPDEPDYEPDYDFE